MRFKDDAVSLNWIDSDAKLADCIGQWGEVIAIDTEFVRTNTYYPMPGLYQVATEGAVYLLDPLAISEWQPLIDVFTRRETVKIMHACQEDMELIHHHLGVQLSNVFDTQQAHAFLSDQFSLSYAGLVQQRLGVDLPKHETRSDWRQRPLNERQIEYAVEDVTFLEPLYDNLTAELHTAGKSAWFDAEMLGRSSYEAPDPQQYYRNIKKAWQLSGAELARLQRLCAWRENKARIENVPRNRVVWDDHLYRFAKMSNLSRVQLQKMLPRGVVKRYADELIEIVAQVDGAAPEALPRPLTSLQGTWVKKLKALGLEVANAQQVAPELVCRKRDLEACVRHFVLSGEISPLYKGWRFDVVGADFHSLLVDLSGTSETSNTSGGLI